MKDSASLHFIAGGIAGATEAFVMYPTEFVKTQLQLQNKLKGGPQYTGPFHVLTSIVQQRGILGLYQGLSTLVTGTFVKAAIRFYSYNNYVKLLSDENGKISRTSVAIAGMGAGITEAIFAVTPTDTIKTKLIHDRNSSNPKYRGMIHGIRTIVKTEGLAGIYQGLIPTMLRQGGNSAIRFTVFGNCQKVWQDILGKKDVGIIRSFISGAVSGTVATILTMPVDVIKTRLQGLDRANYKGVIDCGIKIFRDEGIKTFWKGTTPRLSRVIFSSGIVFSIQDFIMRLLRDA